MTAEPKSAETTDRRRFIGDSARLAGAVAAGSVFTFFAMRKGEAGTTRWQLDPDKCMGCGNCASYCVLDTSAVKCVQCFDMCGYCDICTGYFDTDYLDLDTAAENQLCPTGAVERKFVEEKAGQRFYEYTIDEPKCIGCGKCVKGCALMNGSLYLQVMHDRCVNCNECSISAACPTDAFSRVPAETPYLMKQPALALVKQRARNSSDRAARELLRRVHDR